MPKKTPSFIAEFELNINNDVASSLLSRFEAARQVYNACLGEALRRWDFLKESEPYQTTKAMPRTINGEPNFDRKKAFNEARKQFAFSEYDMHSYSTRFVNSWLGVHLDSSTIQKIATRAFRAVNEYSIGKRGKPRFKGKDRPLKSVEGKSNESGIRYKDGRIFWFGLDMPLIVDEEDSVHIHALESFINNKGKKVLAHRVKYVRLLWRDMFGRKRWFAQLVMEGFPYRKPKNVTQSTTVGLDIGPSTIAIVSDDSADLKQFASELSDKSKEIARLQRQIDRQRRSNNPDNYEADRWVKNSNGNWKRKQGKNKKGKQQWVASNRQKKNQSRLREVNRKLAAHRKSLHGKMINEILARHDC